MGQNESQEILQQEKNKADTMCETFSHGVGYAAQRLKEYLGFEDPQSKLYPSTDTLNEIFLVNFIGYCLEKGVEGHICTSKMNKQQSLLLGVDWLWTLFGPNRNIRLQLAVQTRSVAELLNSEEGKTDEHLGININEIKQADALYKDKERFDKLRGFCSLVGSDCVGLFIVYGMPGKPRDIRGFLMDSIIQQLNGYPSNGESALRNFILNTDTFLSTQEVLEICLFNKDSFKNIGKMFINFL
ncbi:rab15 effector protein [Protopterus annectens]|uniref:rab15 effector protein n=1 Tax=Protopterus annectens TaxID=7888 RepID=UPI001CFA7DE1|nr:rab15 effector protein [Protopterus annectens]